jgi:hypothetical protein
MLHVDTLNTLMRPAAPQVWLLLPAQGTSQSESGSDALEAGWLVPQKHWVPNSTPPKALDCEAQKRVHKSTVMEADVRFTPDSKR